MDRTEAKDILNYDIRQYIKQCEDATDEDFEALDLAIEALQTMRCGDCEHYDLVCDSDGNEWEVCKREPEEYRWFEVKAMDIMCESGIINSISSVTPPSKVIAKIKVDTEELVERVKEEYQLERAGEWIEDGYYDYPYYVCSNCGQECGVQSNGVAIEPLRTKYCPNCGAKMKGANYETN